MVPALPAPADLVHPAPTCGPAPPPLQVHNNFGGGFVSDDDRVALSAIKFASAESAGARCISSDDGHNAWLEASMEQLCVPLPPWSLRAGARETIWFNPAEVNAASARLRCLAALGLGGAQQPRGAAPAPT